jgi:hypothetical protein
MDSVRARVRFQFVMAGPQRSWGLSRPPVPLRLAHEVMDPAAARQSKVGSRSSLGNLRTANCTSLGSAALCQGLCGDPNSRSIPCASPMQIPNPSDPLFQFPCLGLPARSRRAPAQPGRAWLDAVFEKGVQMPRARRGCHAGGPREGAGPFGLKARVCLPELSFRRFALRWFDNGRVVRLH